MHTSRVQFAEKTAAGYVLAQRFGVPKGTPLFRLVRARIGNGHALAIDDTHILYDLIPDVESIDFSVCSLYTTLEQNSVRLAKAQQVLTVYTMRGEGARVLELADGTPVFRIEHQVYNSEDQMVEHTLSYVSPARASISSYLKR